VSAPCQHPIDERALLAYWLGEVAGADEARIDEHLLGCGHCSERLGELAALAGGVREALRRGKVHAFVSEPFIRRLAEQGLRVREYHLPHNGSVNCTVTPEDDLVVSHLAAPLAGVSRVDVVLSAPGLPTEVFQDVPFDAARGEVVYAPNTTELRAAPSFRLRLELVAVEGQDKRLIGDYTFNHTAQRN
jgi:hypothetical protein